MAGLVSELVLLLQEQTELYENLLALSEEKKDAIIKNNIDELQKVTSVENIIISKNQKLEKKRSIAVSDIALVLGKTENELTLSVLLQIIENQPEYESLKLISDKMLSIIERLKEINENNKMLLLNALDYVDFSLNLFRSTVLKEAPTYSQEGGSYADKNVFFDAKQ